MPIMSIPVNDRIERLVASGGQTAFTFDFPVYAAGDLLVRRVRAGIDAVLSIGTDYTVSGVGNQGGGTVTLTASALAGDVILIKSVQPAQRATDFVNGGELPAEAVDEELNRIAISLQQLLAQVSGAVQRPDSDAAAMVLPPVASRAGRYLAFDSLGNIIAAALTAATVPIVSAELDVKASGYIRADGSDDTTGWRNAAATGFPLYYSGGNTVVSGKVDITGPGQYVRGHPERSVVTGIGNFDTFAFAGAVQGQAVRGITFSSAGKTGGADISFRNANRWEVEGCRFISTWTAIYAEMFNIGRTRSMVVDGCRGPRMIHLYGTASTPGYVFQNEWFNGAATVGANCTALEIDGAVYTVDLGKFQVNGSPSGAVTTDLTRGIWVRDTPSVAADAAFIFGDNVQVDFPAQEAIRLDVGVSVRLGKLYAQGSKLASGVHIAAASASVALGDAYVRGNAQHGIFHAGDDLTVNGGQVAFNSLSQLGAFDGVHCAATSERTVLSGVSIGTIEGAGGTHRWGVYGAAGAADISVVGCALAGNLAGPYRDDTGSVLPDNFNVVGCSGVGHSWDGAVVTGSTAGFGAQATITVSGGVIQPTVTVTDGGKKYSTPPTVFAFDPAATGSGATFTATVANGAVTAVTRTAGGSGYGPNTFLIFISAEAPPGVRAYLPNTTNANFEAGALGNGSVVLRNDQGLAFVAQAVSLNTANYLTARAFAAGSSPDLVATGSDANINVGLLPKGTGRLVLGGPTAGAAGAVASYLEVIVGGTTYKVPLHAV